MANNSEQYQKCKANEEAQMEKAFLKGEKDLDLGVYRSIFSASCGVEGQDGGVVTALLVDGLERGMFDVAIVVQRKQGYSAEAVVANNIGEVTAARGTKYLRAKVTPKLRDAIKQGAKRVAIVCTPCEVAAARKIQQTNHCEATVIGLFCSEAFNADKLKQEVKARLGVDLDRAAKTQIRHGKFTAQTDDKDFSCRVKDLEAAAEKACRYCDDFTSRLADISVGSVGSKRGYSTVIVRSEAGQRLVDGLDCVKEAVNREEIVKLIRFKENRAKDSFAALKNRP
jgi:coenzyme F420-reducing hydrogenase beta subunit